MTLSDEAFAKPVERGFTKLLEFTVSVEFLKASFGHIGSAKSPLKAGKDLPVFKIDDRPVIPATSLKGAWRSRLETFLQEKQSEFAEKYQASVEHWRPCIPTTRASQAETDRLKDKRWLTGCQVSLEEQRIAVNKSFKGSRNFLCPVCYFFGANGLQGFLRVGNLLLVSSAVATFDHDVSPRDRGIDAVRPGAPIKGEHVKGGTKFQGFAELLLFDGTFTFGEARSVRYEEEHEGQKKPVEIHFDPWLQAFAKKQTVLDERRLALLNELLIPALQRIDILGGHRSKGGGRVKVEISLAKN